MDIITLSSSSTRVGRQASLSCAAQYHIRARATAVPVSEFERCSGPLQASVIRSVTGRSTKVYAYESLAGLCLLEKSASAIQRSAAVHWQNDGAGCKQFPLRDLSISWAQWELWAGQRCQDLARHPCGMPNAAAAPK